jgi:beta-barrel assembly-enhancing protease
MSIAAEKNISYSFSHGCELIGKPFKWAGRKIYAVYDAVLPQNEVTGERELKLLSLRIEKFIGDLYYSSMIDSLGGKVSETIVQKEFEDIGARLALQTARKGLDYQFTVLQNSSINAWALPNGKIAIYTGMISKIDEVSKKIKSCESSSKWSKYKDITILDLKAAVLAHEIIHSDARHTARRVEKTFIIHFALYIFQYIASFFIRNKLKKETKSKDEADHTPQILNALDRFCSFLHKQGLNLYLYANSKTQEHQADTYGMSLMQKAGFNPKAALALQEIFIDLEGGEPSKLMRYTLGLLRTHPFAVDRLKANQDKLQELQIKETELPKKVVKKTKDSGLITLL